MPRAAILTALPVEYLAVRNHLTNLQEEVHPNGTIYERGSFAVGNRTWEIGIVEIGVGNSGAALEAERAIAHFNPDVVLFVGVAGGIKDVDIGDVVASTKVYGYESGKVEQTFKPRPEIGLPAYELEQRARAEARKPDWLQRISALTTSPRVFVAPIAAGEKVIASTTSDLFQFLRSNYGDAVAVEMEGLGFLEAARANKQVSAMVIRGISDLIDGKAEADKADSQKLAAHHASAFAFEILAKFQPKGNAGGNAKVNYNVAGDYVAGDKLMGDNIVQNNSGNARGFQTIVKGGNVNIGENHIYNTAPPTPSPSARPSDKLQSTDRNMNDKSTSPQVFISYSHDSQAHKDRILALADRLREDGIDCNIDQYEESPPQGWPRWMLDRVEAADFVLIACTQQYDRRFRGNEAYGKGRGVTWEGGVIIQELYDGQGQNSKFIPITLTEEDTKFISSPLRGDTSYRLQNEDGYELLYRRLTNQPKTKKPELGKLQTLPSRDRRQDFQANPSPHVNVTAPTTEPSIAQVQELIEEALSDDELRTLCQGKFPKVYRQFTTGLTKSHKISLLLEHTERHREIPKLLKAIELINPSAYDRFTLKIVNGTIDNDIADLQRNGSPIYYSQNGKLIRENADGRKYEYRRLADGSETILAEVVE